MARQATLLVADEIYYNLHGKAILQGIYHTDLIIPINPTTVPQLIFYFMMETDAADAFRSLAVEVKLPESTPVRHQVFVTFPVPPFEGRKVFYRHPLLVQGPTLRPGRIEAKVIHEEGEILVGAPWIAPIPVLPKPH
jgi:hypothetical protein